MRWSLLLNLWLIPLYSREVKSSVKSAIDDDDESYCADDEYALENIDWQNDTSDSTDWEKTFRIQRHRIKLRLQLRSLKEIDTFPSIQTYKTFNGNTTVLAKCFWEI